MAQAKRRYGAHLSDAARTALAAQRPYPMLAALHNPLTRELVRQIAEAEWRATYEQIDFSYSLNDVKIGGVPCVVFRPSEVRSARPIILYLHAGGFVCGSPRANATAILPACHLSACEAIAIDYRLAPEAVYPSQLGEIEAVWRTMLAGGRDPKSVILAGDSSGGALAVASLYRWRREGLAMPAGLVLLSPLLDAQASSDTHQTLRHADPLFAGRGEETCEEVFRIYAGAADSLHPEISPILGDPRGFPPTLIHVGAREVLLGEAARFSEKARRAGVDVSLRVFDGMFHLFHQHWRLAEAKAAHQDVADFIARAAQGGSRT